MRTVLASDARQVAIVLAAVLTAACGTTEPELGYEVAGAVWADLGKPCSAEAPATALSPAARAALGAPRSRDTNVEWAELSRRVPGGWGGFFYHQGTPTMYLVDPTQKDAAVAALHAERFYHVSSHVVVRKGRWDYAQMHDWYRYLRPYAVAGVHQADIDESANRLSYTAIDQAALHRFESVLTLLDVPCLLVAVEIGPMAMAL